MGAKDELHFAFLVSFAIFCSMSGDSGSARCCGYGLTEN
jgi:hypothetical protein